MTSDDPTQAAKIAIRSQWIVTACLAAVILVMAVALSVVVGVASSAQGRAGQQALVARELQNELACRSKITSRITSAEGEVISLVALTVVKRARAELVELSELIDRIDDAIDELSGATEAGVTAVEDCARESSAEGK